MRPTRFSALLAATLLALVASCVESDAPAAPGGGTEGLTIPISAADLPQGAEAPPTINRIRAVARALPGGTVLGSVVLDVAPGADSWSVEIPVELGGLPGATVEVTFELITVSATGQETVQFAGKTEPIVVRAGVDAKPVTLPLVRGGLGNLKVTGVTITEPLPAILEGATTTLAATVTTSDPTLAGTVFWSSLDATATVTGNVATGVLPGTARIVATAGTKTDTAVLTVRARPASVQVTPDSQTVVGNGVTVPLAGAVLDARNAPIADQPVLWRSLTPGILEDQGGGRFRSVAPGRGVAEARAAADTTLKATAVVRIFRNPTDVALTKSAPTASVFEGDSVTFTISATNRGSATAGAVRVAEELPTGLALVSASPSVGTFEAGAWSLGDLAPGASATLLVRARTSGSAAGAVLVNAARLLPLADQQDLDASNDVATASVTIVQRTADLAVAKTAQAPTVANGDIARFTVTLTNRGPNVAPAVTVVDSLPTGLAYLNHTNSRGTFDSGTRTWTLSDVAPGTTETLVIEARVSGTDGASLRNRARRVGAVGVVDLNPDNDTASAAITVGPTGPKVDLHVLKAVTPGTVAEGDTAQFQVIVINHGPIPATNIVVRDTLPTGLTFVSHTANAGLYLTGNWSIASLDPGQADTLWVKAFATAGTGGTIKRNEARRTASVQIDSVPANDYAYADLTVESPPVQPSPQAFHTVGNVQLVAGGFSPPTTPFLSDPGNALTGLTGFTVLTTGEISTALGGTIDIAANGDFTYFPPVGVTDVVDSISVAVMDPNENPTVVRLDLTIDTTLVWFVDNANHADGLPGLPGSSVRPYSSTLEAEAASTPGDVIFVHTGEIAYDRIVLKDDQSLIGEGADLVVPVNGTDRTLLNAGTRPSLTEVEGTTITLANHNRVIGLDVAGDVYSYGIHGNDVTDVEISDVAIPTGYKGLVLEYVGGTVSVSNLEVGSMDETAIDLQSPTGLYAFTGLSVPNHGGYGAGLYVQGGDATIEIDLADGSISSTGGSPIWVSYFYGDLHVQGGTIEGNGSEGVLIESGGGTVTFDAPINLVDTHGPAFAMAGTETDVHLDGLDILNSGMNPGITATGGGTLSIVGIDNVVATDSAVAVWIQGGSNDCVECIPTVGTAIGADGVRLRSVSSNAADYGILVDQTAVAQGGPFEVTGNGAPGSGGHIANSLYAGIQLGFVRDVTLQDLSITSSQNTAIEAWAVDNLALRRSAVLDTAYNSSISLYNVTGVLDLSDLHVHNPDDASIDLYNDQGTLTVNAARLELDSSRDCECGATLLYVEGAYTASIDMTVDASTFHDAYGEAISAYADLGATVGLTITGTTFDSVSDGIVADVGDGSSLTVLVSGSTFSDLDYGIDLYQYGSGDLAYDVTGNVFSGVTSEAFSAASGTIQSSASGVHNGKLDGNEYSGGVPYAQAVNVVVDGTVHGTVTIENETIGIAEPYGSYGAGITVKVNESAQLGVTLADNTIDLDDATEGFGVDVSLNNSLAPPPSICLSFKGNTITGTSDAFQIFNDGIGAFGLDGLASAVDQFGALAAIMADNPGFNPLEDVYRYVEYGTYLPCSGGVPPDQ